MGRYRKIAVEIEAIQFTGRNWAELQLFTGKREIEPGYLVPMINPIGTYLAAHLYEEGAAEMWVSALSTHLVVDVGDWVVRDRGYHPYKKHVFETAHELVEEN